MRKRQRQQRAFKAPAAKFRKNEKEVNFLDLPEEVFRKIFAYLPDPVLHFLLRNVCRKLREYVDGYVQYGK